MASKTHTAYSQMETKPTEQKEDCQQPTTDCGFEEANGEGVFAGWGWGGWNQTHVQQPESSMGFTAVLQAKHLQCLSSD